MMRLSWLRKWRATRRNRVVANGTQRNTFQAAQKSIRHSCSVIDVTVAREETQYGPHVTTSSRRLGRAIWVVVALGSPVTRSDAYGALLLERPGARLGNPFAVAPVAGP